LLVCIKKALSFQDFENSDPRAREFVEASSNLYVTNHRFVIGFSVPGFDSLQLDAGVPESCAGYWTKKTGSASNR